MLVNIPTIRSGRFRRLFKEGSWVILGQVIALLGSLVGVRLLTGLLDPAAYGELALGMTVAALVNQAVLGPLSAGVTRFFAPAQEQGDLHGYLRASRRLVLYATGSIILITLIMVAGFLVAGRAEWIAIAIAALIFATLSGYNSILIGIQNAARQRFIVALHQGMEPWLRFFAAAGLIVLLGATSTVAMVGYAMGAILILESQYLFFRRIVPEHVTGENTAIIWRKRVSDFSWPISIFGMFTWLQLASDRWALGFFSTTKDVGMYAVLFQLGYYPMSTATEITVQFLAPIFYQQAGDASDRRRKRDVSSLSWRLTRLALGVTAAAFLLVFIVHSQIFRICVAEEYASVSHLLPYMVLAGGIFAAGQSIALNLMSQMKTREMMTAKIATALMGVISNIAGAYWYGTVGIVIAGALFSLAYFSWMVMLSKRTARLFSNEGFQ